MLKGIPSLMTPDLLWVLAAMGHGDELAVVDRNFPAHALASQTRSGRLVALSGATTPQAIDAIVQLMPLDNFVPTALWRMDPVDQPGTVLPVAREMLQHCEAAEGRSLRCDALERHAFYAAVPRCFAVVHTSEDRPYGCFILKKGVVFERPAAAE